MKEKQAENYSDMCLTPLTKIQLKFLSCGMSCVAAAIA